MDNVKEYNNYTYNQTTSARHDISAKTEQQLKDIESKINMYKGEHNPTGDELISLSKDVIDFTNNVMFDKTKTAFEKAMPGSKVTSVSHSYDDSDSTSPGKNLLEIKYTDKNGKAQTKTLKNSFEGEHGILEGLLIKDTIQDTYTSDRFLNKYKLSPDAKKDLTEIEKHFKSIKNLSVKDFVYKDGVIWDNLSSKVPEGDER